MRRRLLLVACLLSLPAGLLAAVEITLPNAEESTKFAVMGDSGSGAGRQYQLAAQFAAAYKAFPFSFVLMLGDNIYGGKFKKIVQVFEIPYAELLKRGVTFHATLGNHDIRCATEQMEYKGFNMGGKPNYSFAPAGDLVEFFTIDTTALVALGDPARTLLNVTRRLHELEDETQVRRVIVWREQRTHPEVRERLRDYRRQLQGLVEHVLGASILHPIAARRVRTAAAAWVAIITTPSPADLAATDGLETEGPQDGAPDAADEAMDLPELAELICAGLNAPAA